MASYLRVFGKDLDVDSMISDLDLLPARVHKRNEPKLPASQPDGPRNEYSSANFCISNADFHEFERQISESLEYLKGEENFLRTVLDYPGVEGAGLDFGVQCGTSPVHFFEFPTELLRISADIGLSIEISLYHLVGENDRTEKS